MGKAEGSSSTSTSAASSSTSTLTLALVLASAFLLTALLGVWAAWDRGGAWQAFGLLAAGLGLGAVVVWAGRRGGVRALGAMSVAAALLAGAIGVYFLLAYDWAASPGKFALLQHIGEAVQARRPAIALPEDINANVAASGLAPCLFIGLGGLIWAAEQRRRATILVAALAWLAGAAALLLSASRGAWLGVAGGLVAMAYLMLRRRFAGRRGPRAALDLLALAAIVLLAAGFYAAVRSPQAVQVLGAVPAGDGAIGRSVLWRDGLALAGDYPFTGAGLGSAMMLYSTYGLLLHVGFISHMHNTFVEMTIEQGAAASLAFLGLMGIAAANVLAATRPGQPAWRFGLAAGGALAAMLVHGMLDAGLYASLMAPLMFLPIAFALAPDPSAGARARPRRSNDWMLAIAVLAAGVIALLLFLPTGRAAFQANLGAVAQQRAELSRYSWPEWPIQDALRRSPEIDLGPALARYGAALAENPANATANRRLGQIELSRGDYGPARQHLEQAYATRPGDRATRQLLGESYAIAGDLDRAAALWRTIDLGNGQLDARIWWYDHIGEPEHAERIRETKTKVEAGAEGNSS